MHVIEIKPVEDCLDGSTVMDMILDKPVTEALITSFTRYGDLRYYPDFARPFFTLNNQEICKLKGIEGNRSIRCILYRNDKAESKKMVLSWIETFDVCIREPKGADAL